MARSSTRAKPYVVEIQRHYHLDELDSRRKRGYQNRPPVATSKIPPRAHLSTRRSLKGEVSYAKRAPVDPARLKSGSLEYEDIYDQRNLPGHNPHLKQPDRWSFRDDSGYDRVRGYTRRAPGIAHPTEMRPMINGDVGHENGRVSNHGPMRASYKGGQVRTSEGPSHEQTRIARDKNDNQHDDLELWIARQTSFPKKQDDKTEGTSNQRISGKHAASHEMSQSNSIHKMSKNVIPPKVSLKPPRPQTSRSASPALSIQSSQSGASRASHHSARSGTSEVSVVSIAGHETKSRFTFLVVQHVSFIDFSPAIQHKDI